MGDSLLILIKFLLAVLLLPIAWAAAAMFHQFAGDFPGTDSDFFFLGMFGFLLIFLFFYQFWGVYEFGQKVVAGIFRFTAPADRFVANIIPFYLTAVMLLFYVTTGFLGIDKYNHYFLFFAGFSCAMHLILTAQDLQQQEKTFIKPEYLFKMVVQLILFVAVAVLLFNLAYGEFTFPKFAKSTISDAMDIYRVSADKILFAK